MSRVGNKSSYTSVSIPNDIGIKNYVLAIQIVLVLFLSPCRLNKYPTWSTSNELLAVQKSEPLFSRRPLCLKKIIQ